MSEQVSAGRRETSVPPPVMDEEPVSGWAVGFAIFAGVMMAMVGTFQAIQGLAAIVEDKFYVALPNYWVELDVTAWGWLHLTLGILVAVAGFCVFSGRLWARAVGIAAAVVNAISQFLFMPYYPVWSIVMIAVDIAVIWALCVYSRGAVERSRY